MLNLILFCAGYVCGHYLCRSDRNENANAELSATKYKTDKHEFTIADVQNRFVQYVFKIFRKIRLRCLRHMELSSENWLKEPVGTRIRD